jgi:hypothetical protein
MSTHERASWLQRLYRRITRLTTASPKSTAPDRPAEVSIEPAQVSSTGAAGLRSVEDWRDLVRRGRRVTLTWDGGPRCGTIMTGGEVRLLFEDSIWVWLDDQLPERDRPTAGQVMQLLTPGDDAMRLIPCQLVDEGRGGSLQVTVSGRLSRVQRRDDVRAKVDLPPVSGVRLDASGKPMGLLGLELVDLSAGGIRARVGEPVAAGEQIRVVLRLDNGQPLTPVVDVLDGGQVARGKFCPMPEDERRRIVQFVYHQELIERQRAQAAAPAD